MTNNEEVMLILLEQGNADSTVGNTTKQRYHWISNKY